MNDDVIETISGGRRNMRSLRCSYNDGVRFCIHGFEKYYTDVCDKLILQRV